MASRARPTGPGIADRGGGAAGFWRRPSASAGPRWRAKRRRSAARARRAAGRRKIEVAIKQLTYIH